MTVVNYIGISARKRAQQDALRADIDAYLAAGGTIEQIPPGSAHVPETVQEALREALHMAERASGRVAAKALPVKGKTRAERNRLDYAASPAVRRGRPGQNYRPPARRKTKNSDDHQWRDD